MRCWVTDNNQAPAVAGCSSDNFSIRPQAFSTITSVSAGADGTGQSTMASPVIKMRRYLKFCRVNYDRNPLARATFGVNVTNRQINMREGY